MAPSNSFSKSLQNHARADSMPSNPHPLVLECNEHLTRLGSSSTASTSSSSISHRLDGLQDLHDCVGKLFQLPFAQRVIVRESQEKWVDEVLEASLRLLDACTAAKDAIVHTRECARELQSTIRRSRSGSVEVEAEVRKYIASRKVVRKAICKALKSLNVQQSRCSADSAANKDHEAMELISLTREMEAVTLAVLESLLSYVSSGPAHSKSSSWFVVSKLMQTKKVACIEEAEENLFSKVDNSLRCLLLDMKIKYDCVHHMSCNFEELESCTQDLEEGLDRLFKKLIRFRVSLLNTLNH